nr:MAG TPA: hypothetical protein [Herelleviridae sp.]
MIDLLIIALYIITYNIIINNTKVLDKNNSKE